MKLFNELPSILPFFTDLRNQNRFKENVKNKCPFFLMSPNNALLPFLLQIPKGSPKPSSLKLISLNGSETDLSNNIPQLKAVDFEDFAYCYYNGQALTFKYETIEQELNLEGIFYIELTISGIKYFSEVFKMTEEIKSDSFNNRFVKLEYWDEEDIEPIRYRDNFKQVIYFDTFIYTSEPEITQETEGDGDSNEIPTFQKMTIRQKIEILVPDFVKIALMSMQMHSNIFINEQNKRQGKIDRVKMTPTTEANGALTTLEIVLETDILTKRGGCKDNKTATNENLWA